MLIFPKFSPLKKIDFAHILACEKGILHNLRFLFETPNICYCLYEI